MSTQKKLTVREQRQALFNLDQDSMVVLGTVTMTAREARHQLFEFSYQDEYSPWFLSI